MMDSSRKARLGSAAHRWWLWAAAPRVVPPALPDGLARAAAGLFAGVSGALPVALVCLVWGLPLGIAAAAGLLAAAAGVIWCRQVIAMMRVVLLALDAAEALLFLALL